jgi:hypothetical protein
MLSAIIWFRIVSSVGLLWTRWWTMKGIEFLIIWATSSFSLRILRHLTTWKYLMSNRGRVSKLQVLQEPTIFLTVSWLLLT